MLEAAIAIIPFMAHTVWLGGAGTGKTYQLIERYLQKLKQSSPTQQVFWVVPTHEHADRIRNLLLGQSQASGLFSPNVLVFNELMEKLAGPMKRGDVSNSLRAYLLKQVLLEVKDRLQVFHTVAQLPGFLKVLIPLIVEFENLKLVGPRGQGALKKIVTAGLLRQKLADVDLIAQLYFLKLEKLQLFSQTELYLRWADKLAKRPEVLKNIAAIYFDGFFDLNAVQQTWLQLLNQKHIEIIFTLTYESSASRAELFTLPHQTLQFFKSAGFDIAEFTEPKRFASSELTHLAENLFLPALKFSGLVKNITLLQPVNPRFEIKMLAQKVAQLLQQDVSLQHSDICVIYHDLSFVRSALETIFAEYQIPVHVHERMWFKDIPLIQFLLGILSIFKNGWQLVDVMNYLKSDFLKLTPEVKANIELAAMLQPNLKPTEAWKELLGPLVELEQALKISGSSALAAQSLKKFLYRIVFQSTDIFKCDRRDVFAFEELARTFMEVDAHFEAGYEFERYLEQLATAIEIHLVSMPAPTHDAVQVYTVSLARQKEYRVVLVAGLIEKQFPKQVFENPLFSDEERCLIHPHLSLASSRRQNESYLYYLALTRAHEKLFLSYPQYNAENQKTLSSFFLQQTLQLFENQAVPVAHQNYLGHLLGALPLRTSDYCLQVVDDLKHRKATRYQIKNLEPQIFAKFARIAANELNVQLNEVPQAFMKNQFSPSRLSDLSQCAYRYFAKNELHLSERPSWESRKTQAKGNFFHVVLYEFYKQLIAQPNWATLESGALSQQIQIVFDQVLAQPDHHWLAGEKLNIRLEKDHMQKTLLQFLETDHARLMQRGLKPLLLESELKATFKTEHLNLVLTGKMDRVDQAASGEYLLRDYKTGWTFKSEKIKTGQALQIPTYLYLLAKQYGISKIIGGEIYAIQSDKPNGIYCESAKTLLPDLKSRKNIIYLNPEDFENFLTSYEKYVAELIHTRRNAGVTIHPKSCDYCEYAALCRYQGWMEKFISQEALAEVIPLGVGA